MGIQFAREVKQPGETLRYTMEFKAGAREALAEGDTLSGSPTVKVYRRSDGVDVTSDAAGPPAITGMLSGDPTMSNNIVYFFIKGGVSGESYKVTVKSDTTNGEKSVEEDLVIFVREL